MSAQEDAGESSAIVLGQSGDEERLNRLIESHRRSTGLGSVRSLIIEGRHFASTNGIEYEMQMRLLYPLYIEKTLRDGITARTFTFDGQEVEFVQNLVGFDEAQAVEMSAPDKIFKDHVFVEGAMLWNSGIESNEPVSLRFGEVVRFNNRPCEVIVSTFPSGVEVEHLLLRSGREVARRIHSVASSGQATSIVIEFDDFQRVGTGFLPHRYTFRQEGVPGTLRVTVDAYKLNAGLHSWMF